jgi:hypothetical protein
VAALAAVAPWVVALSMIAYRYANLRSLSFINDEPAFLSAARDQLGAGHWVSVSPLVGKQGLHYGPTVLWFYGLVHLVFGPNPTTHIVAMLTCMTAAHVALACGIGRRFGSLVGATALALIASSPYQFFWSRLAWDQSVDIASALIAFVFCACQRITPGVGVFLGLTVGLAISSHLMVLPLALVAGSLLALESILRREWVPLALAGLTALVVNIPYLMYLSHHFHEASPAETFSWDLAKTFATEPARVASLQGIDYFFDDAWSDFVTSVGRWRGSLLLTPGAPLAVAVVAAVGLALVTWKRRGSDRRASLCALVTWLAYVVFFAQRRVGNPPHYQFATWWVIPVGVASALWAMQRWSRWLGAGAVAAVWLFSIAQMRFICDWMAYVRSHGGTQGVHYGTPLAEQKAAIDAVCTGDHERIQVWNDTHLFDLSLRYVGSTEPRCAGKVLAFCGSEDCSRVRDAARVHIAYARPGAGWLFLKFAQ